jgi:hypothetical protein
MGAKLSTIGTASASAPATSFDVLIKNTARDRAMLEQFFLTFLQTITPKEMRELYSIPQCNKYAFLMAQSMRKFFKATPVKGMDPRQLVYYVRLEGRAKEEHTSDFYVNCFQVGYFYIRMLQIFCALALTVSTKGVENYMTSGPVQQLPRDFVSFPGMMGGAGYIQFGDDIPEILASYLSNDGKGPQFKVMSRYYYENGEIQYKNQQGDKILIKCKIEKSPVEKSSKIILKDFELNGKILQENGKVYERYIDVKKSMSGVYQSLDLKNKEENLLSRLTIEINTAIKKFEKQSTTAAKTGSTTTSTGIPIGRERFELKVENLVTRLSGNDTKPYAIARALQLLDLTPLYGYDRKRGAQFRSYIHDFSYSPIIGNAPFIGATKFKEYGALNDNLENVMGLRALEKLYYDNTDHLEDKAASDGEKFRINPKNVDEYWKFLKTLECMYKDTSISEDSTKILQGKDKTKESKSGIIMFKVENKGGKANPGIKILSTADPSQKRTIDIVKSFQAKLFAYQQKHTKDVMAFIQKYIIGTDSSGRIKLNDKFITEGIPYINRLGEAVRSILLKYYVTCESYYSKAYNAVATNGASAGRNLQECVSAL